MKTSSGVYRLDPFLGGRLSRADMTEDIKHPIILLKKGHLITLIIRYFHAKVQHSGREITLNEMRANGYWVVNGNAAVRSVIAKCVKCRQLRGSVGEQNMKNLPESRLKPAPPFTYCAVDYFGPWLVKQGHKKVKRYGSLFTCLASRAVHIEVSDSLDVDSFLHVLRRFIARGGPIRDISSDQGINFVGADSELKRAYKEIDDNRAKAELLKNNIDWKKNPPAASHFGGVWERQIRSIRNILAALIKEHGHRLNDEKLRTLLTLLTGKSKVILPPPGKFQHTDLYCRRQWRHVLHLTNEFWKRLKNEYLQSLQPRQKWNKEKRNFEEGDVVLIKDNDLPRNQWSMGRVVSTKADEQGLVRSVHLRMASGSTLERPIDKLVLLLETEI